MLHLYKLNKSFTYRNDDAVEVLKNINFTFSGTGLIGIHGESGCGKTTLINIAYGILEPDDGEVLVNSMNINTTPKTELWRKEYSFIYQNLRLCNELTAYDNVKFGSLIEDSKVLTNSLEVVGLEDHINSLVGNLSGGQKQRVAIARAISKRPKYLFVDEPTSSLDHDNAKAVMDLFKIISKECLVIFVSHDIELINEYSDHIIDITKENNVEYVKNSVRIKQRKYNYFHLRTKDIITVAKSQIKKLWKVFLLYLVSLFISFISIVMLLQFGNNLKNEKIVLEKSITDSRVIYLSGSNDDLMLYKNEYKDKSYFIIDNESLQLQFSGNIISPEVRINPNIETEIVLVNSNFKSEYSLEEFENSVINVKINDIEQLYEISEVVTDSILAGSVVYLPLNLLNDYSNESTRLAIIDDNILNIYNEIVRNEKLYVLNDPINHKNTFDTYHEPINLMVKTTLALLMMEIVFLTILILCFIYSFFKEYIITLYHYGMEEFDLVKMIFPVVSIIQSIALMFSILFYPLHKYFLNKVINNIFTTKNHQYLTFNMGTIIDFFIICIVLIIFSYSLISARIWVTLKGADYYFKTKKYLQRLFWKTNIKKYFSRFQ